MSLATDLRDDVAALLDDPDYGRDATLVKTSAGTYNSANGEVTGQSDTSYNTRVIVLGYEDFFVEGQGMVKKYARKIILKVKDLAVLAEENDRIVVGSDHYSVLRVRQGELGGTTYLQTLLVR